MALLHRPDRDDDPESAAGHVGAGVLARRGPRFRAEGTRGEPDEDDERFGGVQEAAGQIEARGERGGACQG